MELPTTLYPLWMMVGPVAYGSLALIATFTPGSRPSFLLRAARWSGWLGLATALLAAAMAYVKGSMQTPLLGAGGLGLSLRLDALSALMLVMIALLALVILRYSATYMDGDPHQGVFMGRLGLTISAVQCLVMSSNLLLFFLAWMATGISLQRLLVFYPERPGAQSAGRKKRIISRTNEAALLGAFLLVYQATGTGQLQAIFIDLTRPDFVAAHARLIGLAGVLMALAALLKSAQFPTHSWVTEVMETPTPVSALLHAGILNAGPFLVVRFSWLIASAPVAEGLLILVGGFTALFASTALLPQPAIKTALGYSSAAHMGFMLMVSGFGIYSPVMLHLVAHSFYKAHAFLASGSVVDTLRTERLSLPVRRGHPLRIGGSLLLALAIYFGLAWLWGVRSDEHPGLLGVGVIVVLGLSQIIAPAFDTKGPGTAVLYTIGMATGVGMAFFSLESSADLLLRNMVPPPGTMHSGRIFLMGLVLLAFTIAVLLQIVGPALPLSRRMQRLALHVRNGLYANAWSDRLSGTYRTSA